MKLNVMGNYDLKAMFLKLKMEIGGEKSREVQSEFQELKGWTEITLEPMWVEEWDFIDSMKYIIKCSHEET
jgi:hypothetical protein